MRVASPIGHYQRAVDPFGYVYLVGLVDRRTIPSPLKVGISMRPKKRLTEMQVGSPFKLEIIKTWKFPSLPCAAQIEYEFHKENRARWAHGEWVNITEEDAIPRIQQLFVDYWKIKPLRNEETGETLYRVGNLIAVGKSLTKSQIQYRRTTYLAEQRKKQGLER